MKEESLRLVEVHVAVFFFGLAGLFGKAILLPAIVIVFGRVFFASLFLGGLLGIRKQSAKLPGIKDYGALFLLGVILAAHWFSFFQSIKISTVALGLLTYSSFPLFVTFLEPWLLKTRLKLKDVVAALVVLAGIALVIPRFQFGNQITPGALWGVLSGLTFALLTVLNRKYAGRFSSLVVAFYQDLAATLVLLPALFFIPFGLNERELLLLVLLGVIFTGVAHTLYIKGLGRISAHKAAVIAGLEPVYGILAAMLLFGEFPSPRMIVGGLLILGAGLYVSLSGKTNFGG